MKKKVLVSVLGILGIVLTTIGITYAFYSYSKTGTKISMIQSGSINFKYTEGSRKIELDEVMPMTDDQGKAQDNYFEFTVDAATQRTIDIPYDITVRKPDSNNLLSDDIVKIYFTKVEEVNNEEKETVLFFDTVDHLNGYTNRKITIPAREKLLYTTSVKAGDTNYSQKYRLRMWVISTANYIEQTEGIDTYPLEGKTYSLTVNVYGEGNDIGESGVATRQNTNITSISLDNTNLPLENGIYTGEFTLPEGVNQLNKTIVVNTENPNATVTCKKVDENGDPIQNVEITDLNLPLTQGTNNFILTVIGEDPTATKEYNISINIKLSPFKTDSWATIQSKVINNDIDDYNIGDTRTIELGNDFGTHTLRLVNKTACTTKTSTAACGFVIEFADIISLQQMNTTDTIAGGYEGSAMYNYVTQTVYNALPSDLKSVMQNTTIATFEGANCPSGSEKDNWNNCITKNQKIYLLAASELTTTTTIANFESMDTSRLEYYTYNNPADSIRIKKHNGTPTQWWLRSIYYTSQPRAFMNITEEGSFSAYWPTNSLGVSPAFRIG